MRANRSPPEKEGDVRIFLNGKWTSSNMLIEHINNEELHRPSSEGITDIKKTLDSLIKRVNELEAILS